jgi:uncharacterized protein
MTCIDIMPEPMRCELISWQDFQRLACKLAGVIADDGFDVELIVAIARGGLVPARVIADYLGVMNVASFRIEHYRGSERTPRAMLRNPLSAEIAGRRVLLVDDVSDSGETFEVGLRHLRECLPDAEIRTATLHHKITSRYVPDYFAAKVIKWRWITYPWAMIEDLGGFIGAMQPRPPDVAGIVDRLWRDHAVRIKPRIVQDVLRFTDR